MSRTGKIARLPHELRAQLNRRLQDGQKTAILLDWLNALPEARDILKANFGGRPIIEQNLIAWKKGGFRDWESREESCNLLRGLIKRSDDLDSVADEVEISRRLSTVMGAELARVANALLDQTTNPGERWNRLRQVLQELFRLRKEDHKTARLVMDKKKAPMPLPHPGWSASPDNVN